ncbi:TM0106 family RecB-like putative nuclease [Blastococcus montanus]|uniref:TM0106 family RecB-like putative nuclease n=1 Tax=Blastococcus montanus TaxID=3144973 RepID=UPI003208BE94
MQRLDGRLVLSPTDLTHHQECRHLTRLDLGVAAGEWAAPETETTDELQLVFDRGVAHEKKYLESLRAAGKTVAEIDTVFYAAGRRRAEAETFEAMRSGVDVVYQGTFFDGAWGGQADFLLRVEVPSSFGGWSYEIADTKLARKLKVAALLQMATYAERLTVLQGVAPGGIHVVTGDGVSRPWRLVDVAAYARRARARLEAFTTAPPSTAPAPIAYCDQCRWAEKCTTELRDADDLGLVAFMRGDHRDALRAAGIPTLAALATAGPEQLAASGIGADARTRLQQQAAEQLRERTTGVASRTLLDPVDGLGLLRLPPPSDGDLYLDFEGDPWFEDGAGIEYLAGIGDRSGGFTALWAHDRPAEKQLVADLIDRIVSAVRADPAMHVYHYAPYEVTALKKLTGGYGVREAELDQLLREERFVDLYPVVRQSMRISKESYSIKKVEAFYGRSHAGAVASALGSVLEYEAWLEDGDQARLDGIEAYNKDDVDSTRELHDWLEQQRAELEAQLGPLPRPAVSVVAPDAKVTEAQAAEQELTDRLHAVGHELLGRPRRLAPPRGPAGVVGGLPPAGLRRRGAGGGRDGAGRAVLRPVRGAGEAQPAVRVRVSGAGHEGVLRWRRAGRGHREAARHGGGARHRDMSTRPQDDRCRAAAAARARSGGPAEHRESARRDPGHRQGRAGQPGLPRTGTGRAPRSRGNALAAG